jgi:hypothetical protein
MIEYSDPLMGVTTREDAMGGRFRKIAVVQGAPPATPEKVWRLLNDQR